MASVDSRILTIGYGNRSLESFTVLLNRFGVHSLVDVRSRPYSKYQVDFTRDRLRRALAEVGIRYAFMGDTLGGRPDDPSCYVDGRVDYGACRERTSYIEAVGRIKNAALKSAGIVLMCSELKPHECHRAKLLGESLTEAGIDVLHIDESGELRLHSDVMALATNAQPSLFGSSFLKSRKRYASSHESVEP